jgi:nanoRNase/pAp phosphatase (c-di-AMP/oligoRNAs hydrolase)
MVSLRSKGDFDVSAIAKRFGGGGHKNAAGFNIPKDQDLEEILEDTLVDVTYDKDQ